jgi:putative ABC transport system ATP-binding protein
MINMQNSIIEIKNLFKTYKSGSSNIIALKNLNLSINKGEFIVIMGPSGSGKSTLLNCMNGLLKSDSGSIKINEMEVTNLSENELSELRQQLGFIFQFYNLHDGLTAHENLELPFIISKKLDLKNRRQKVKEVLKEVGLENKENLYPYELSGGERQRVGIARALIQDPEIILADEPTGDLDSKRAQEIVDLLFKLTLKKQTVVMVTHDKSLLREGMRLVTMRDGNIIFDELVTDKNANSLIEIPT